MPYQDLNVDQELPPVADVTVIGAGAAGIFLAILMGRAGIKVTLIETGHFQIDEQTQELNVIEQTGKVLTASVWGRKRAIGGTTLAWGGQSLPFSSLDFEPRRWVPTDGWPLSFLELNPFYSEANQFMGVDTWDYYEDMLERLKVSSPAFDKDKVCFHVSKWAPEPNFQTLHKEELGQRVHVIYNAVVCNLNFENNVAVSLKAKNLQGKEFQVPLRKLVVAGGALETVRLLLLSIGVNHNNRLGQCFMEHPCVEAGTVDSYDDHSLQRQFNTRLFKKRKYSLRLSASSVLQKKHRLLNCSAGLMFMPPAHALDPYAEIKNFKRSFNPHFLWRLFPSIPNLLKSALALSFNGFYYKPGYQPRLVLMIEQAPLQDSKLTLSTEKDRLGVPRISLNWKISKDSWRTAVEFSEALKSEFSRLKLGQLKLHDKMSLLNENWISELSDVNHHMGGSRMGASPEEGVVDPNLLVYGTSNVFVCSSSVFPTSSHSNPTLTLLALAARLSKHIIAMR